MKLRLCLAYALAMFSYSDCFGDSQPLFALYDFSRSFYNPAYTGWEGKASFSTLGNSRYHNGNAKQLYNYFRHEYYKNNPDYNYFINAESNLLQSGKHTFAAGACFFHQRPEYEYHNELRVNSSYTYNTGKRSFSAGISAQGTRKRLVYDYSIPIGLYFDTTRNMYNIGAGLLYRSEKNNFHLGVSGDHLIPKTFHSNGMIYYRERRSFYVFSSVGIRLSKHWTARPLVMARNCTMWEIQTEVHAFYRNKLKLGAGYSSWRDQCSVILGYTFRNFSLEYANVVDVHKLMPSRIHTLGLKYVLKEKGLAPKH